MVGRSIARAQRRSILVGIIVAIVVAILAVFSVQATNGLPGSPTTKVRAAFDSLGAQLTNGDEVTIAGDRVGQVQNIAYQGGDAVVTMQLKGSHPIYANATAAINDYNLLGTEEINLTPGDPSQGRLQGPIPTDHTQSATDLEDLLNTFTPPTRSSLQTLLIQLGGGLEGQGDDLNGFLGSAPQTFGDLTQIAAAANSPEANLAGLLQTAETLSDRFEGHDAELSGLLTQTDTTLNAVNVDTDKPLDQTLAELPETLQQANTALVALNQPLSNTRQAVSILAPGAVSLADATPDLRSVLINGVTPLDKLPGVVRDADPAVGALTTTLTYAQPLLPRLDEVLSDAITPVQVISEYRGDVQQFSYTFSSFTESHDSAIPYRHFARISLPVNLGDLSGFTTIPRDAYPAPGEAFTEKVK